MKSAVVTPTSQVEKLKIRMGEKGISHAGELRVDIPGVKVGDTTYPERVTVFSKIAGTAQREFPVFFCNISELNIRKILKDGDGGVLPDEAVVHGLRVENPGRFNLVNARIFSNGAINIVVDEETTIVPLIS
ncbi:MAG: hypothetical protein HYV29_08865 [Ignavibacteriales bacterium]|nr:hypothetical protein [Ignavibacteriales bacterium]